jgi:cytochrome c oxidase accessory protein FixG
VTDPVHLPILEAKSSLRADGSRDFVHPADVKGRFAGARRVTFVALILVWLALPWIRIGSHPAVFLDVDRRQFFLFGATFNAQDIWLVFFLVTGLVFGLVYVTALLGRVFCGWACPQTVFLEGVYRPIERLIEGPRAKRLRRNAGPITLEKVGRKAAKHALFVVASVLVAHIFLGYFVSFPKVYEMVRGQPSAHPEAFAWAMGTTLVFYGNFAWFREQMCVIVCPYGRLQSVLIDNDSLVIGYDERRGEPRGKPSDEHGDCVDCDRCVVVCPTGIDIRNGLQLDCIACTACIDACDEVMDRLKRPRGLVRYDSLSGLRGTARRVLRPRLYVYTALLLLGLVVATFAFRKHSDFEANLLRLAGLPYVLEGNQVRNAFEVHLVNKRPTTETFVLEPEAVPGLAFVVPIREATLDSLASTRLPVFVTIDRAAFHGDFAIHLRVRRKDALTEDAISATAKFVGPAT